MRFLISMVFVGMLALSSQAFAKEFSGMAAQVIIRDGKVAAEAFTSNGHETRVWHDDIYYACYSDFSVKNDKLKIKCQSVW
ncbi:hypothetical protein AB8879_09995 [Alphaproteobacteria bacterium LSUCC0744]